MKKQLAAVAGLALLSTPAAFASKARMTALGQATDGGFYIKDQRRTFKNPAYYNVYNNFVIAEWGTDASDFLESNLATETKTEGGFARQTGSFVYGLYIGDDKGSAPTGGTAVSRNTLINDGATIGGTGQDFDVNTGTFLEDNNRLTASFAGDTGIKWGASIYWSKQEQDAGQGGTQATTKNTAEGKTLGTRLGVLANNWEAYAVLDIYDEATGRLNAAGTQLDSLEKNDKYEADFGIQVGGNYVLGPWTFFGEYKTSGNEQTDDSQTTNKTATTETKLITVGAGHTKKISDKATLFTSLIWDRSSTKNKELQSSIETEDKFWDLELNVGVEAKATSWLTLRGAVRQDFFSKDELGYQDTNSAATTREAFGNGSTVLSAGATLTWGKLMLDGTFSAADSTVNNQTTATTGSGGTLRFDDFLSNVSVHYWF